jgi:hypothetical protein
MFAHNPTNEILTLLSHMTEAHFEIKEKKDYLILQSKEPCRIQSMTDFGDDSRHPIIDRVTKSWDFLNRFQDNNGYRFLVINLSEGDDPGLMRTTYVRIEVTDKNRFLSLLKNECQKNPPKADDQHTSCFSIKSGV